MANNEFKGMTERDLMILTYEGLRTLKSEFEDFSKRVTELERFRLEVETRVRTFMWVISMACTILGSVISFIIQHFVK